MLKSLDILIGFSVVMLAMSMSVTLIIQWILHLSEMRGKKLLEGVAELLRHIDPDLVTAETAKQIANRVLTHPMIARGGQNVAK